MIAYNEWAKLSERFPNFELDVFQIMPNHIHGIIALVGAGFTPAQNNVTPAQNNVTPAQNNVTPAQNNVTPAQNNVTPAQNNVTPVQNNVTPAQNNVTPAQNNVTPAQNNVTPAQNNVTPVQNNVTPVQNNVTPAQNNDEINGQPNNHLDLGQPQGLPLRNNDDVIEKNIIPIKPPTVGDIVGAYKSLVANGCLDIYKTKNETMGKLWQRNYYEHIINNELSYQTISDYIINNPAKWNDDKFFANR
jgi:putative transposase